MFIQNAFAGKNHWWRYLVVLIVAFPIGQYIGIIPLLLVIPSEMLKSGTIDFQALDIDSNTGLALMLLPFVISLILLLALIKPIHNKKSVTIITGRNKVDWSRFFFGAAVWLVFSILTAIYTVKTNPDNFVMQFDANKFAVLALIALVLLPIQASFEEILMRGYLYQGSVALFRFRFIGIIITSVLFALLHGLNPEIKEFGFWTVIWQYLFFGLMFGVIAAMDEGTEIAMGAHTINNIFLALFFTHKSSALQTDAVYRIKTIDPMEDLWGLLIFGVLFLIVAALKYKWKNWGKLFEYVKKPGIDKNMAGIDNL